MHRNADLLALQASSPVAAVGSPSPHRTPSVPTVPLPVEVRTALACIVKVMRNVPRDCILDRAEMLHFLNRQARAIERVRDQPVPAPTTARMSPPPPSPTSALPPPPLALSARERAEAVFRNAGDPTMPTAGTTSAVPSPRAAAQAIFLPSASAPLRPRIVVDRKGRGVRVEVRRARAAGQMEMFGQP